MWDPSNPSSFAFVHMDAGTVALSATQPIVWATYHINTAVIETEASSKRQAAAGSSRQQQAAAGSSRQQQAAASSILLPTYC